MECDNALIEIGEEVRLPVPLQSRWVERVEHALQRGPGHRSGGIDRWRAERAERRQSLCCLLERTCVAPDDSAHLLQVVLLGKWRRWRHHDDAKPAIGVFRGVEYEVAPVWQNLGSLFQGPEHRSAINGADRMQLEQKRRHDAKVP